MIENGISDSHPYVRGGRVFHGEKDTLHFCRNATCFSMSDSSLDSLIISGFQFVGNHAAAPLMDFSEISAGAVVIENCRFHGMKGEVLSFRNVDNIRVSDNSFLKCWRSCIRIIGPCSRPIVQNNDIRETGIGYSNYAAINCEGKDFLISGNRIVDFCYIGIGVGNHYADPASQAASGLVCRNEVYQSEDFRRNRHMMLTDSGAIYVWTRNEGVSIAGNFVHDIGGPHGNRGIFGDDGVVNVSVVGNLVLNIENSRCIDIRRCLAVSRRPGSHVEVSNVGNRMEKNVVDGPVRFFVRHGDAGSYKGENTRINGPEEKSEWEARWRRGEL